NAGVGLRAWSIQELLKRGVSEYDFLGGVGRHKSDWGAKTKLSKRFVLGSRQAKNILFRRGPEWEVRTRQSVKKCLPERIITARDGRQEQRRIAEFQAGETATSAAATNTDWFRNALASCY